MAPGWRSTLKVGIHLPQYGPNVQGQPIRAADVSEAARFAEAEGFSSVWVSDHVAVDADGADPFSIIHDATVVLSIAGAATRSVFLGFSVLVVPYRVVPLMAKLLTSLDILMDGRAIAGIGIGNRPLESMALQASWESRGHVTDERLSLLRRMLDGERIELRELGAEDGVDKYVGVAPTGSRRIPIWVGGMSSAALKRASTFGDGWHASFSPCGSEERYSPDRIRPMVEWLRTIRPDRTFVVSMRANREAQPVRGAAGRAFLESAAACLDELVFSPRPWPGDLRSWRHEVEIRA